MIGLRAKVIGGDSKIKFYDFKVKENSTLKEMIEKGSHYTRDDLIGTWDYVDTAAFNQSGKIVPLGLNITFSKDTRSKTLLLAETVSAKTGVHTPSMVFPDMRMLPHLRLFPVPRQKGQKGDSTVSLYITLVFRTSGGKYVMMQREMLGGRTYTAIKRDSSVPAAHPVQPAAGTTVNTALDGIWYTAQGEILSIHQHTYTLSEFGQEVDRGTYRIENGSIWTTSLYTGVTSKFDFRLEGEILYLQDGFGNRYRYTRSPS